MLCSSEYAVSEYRSSKYNEIMKISKKVNAFVYFMFPFIKVVTFSLFQVDHNFISNMSYH